MSYKILFSNIGYAKGIDGSLAQHLKGLGRHLYNRLPVQKHVLRQLKGIIDGESPDVCCFVEIDGGSLHSAYHNQMSSLADETYRFHDIMGKYGEDRWISRAWFHRGKSNGFIAKREVPFERLYFRSGTKRLIYKLMLPGEINLFFAHFSLNWKTRVRQMQEVLELIRASRGEVILMADFNIMRGFSELQPLLEDGTLRILNIENAPTFKFHKRRMTLDVCLVSETLASRAQLRIIEQPFSDHQALLVEI